MTYALKVLAAADSDIDKMYAWLAKQSLQGAERWLRTYLNALHELRTDPLRHALASERALARIGIRECFFGTAHGNTYRILFSLKSSDIHVLRIAVPVSRPCAIGIFRPTERAGA
jgi:plasmid stabilization system protein ParE